MNQSDAFGRRMLFITLVSIVYAMCLFLPVIRIPMADETPSLGWEIVRAAYVWPFTVPWSANILLLLGLAALGMGYAGGAIAAGGIGLTLASLSPFFVDNGLRDFHVGFYVWCAAFLVLGAVAAIEYFAQKQVPLELAD